MDAREVVAVLAQGEAVRPSGGQYMTRCPVHGAGGGDSNPSLSVSSGTDQPVVIKCMAGCETDDVLAAVGLTWADISAPKVEDPRLEGRREWTPGGDAVAIYDYVDRHGALVFQVLRTADKKFFQRQRDAAAKSGWKWRSVDAADRPLYRLPQVIEAIDGGREIWLCEGEKDVEALVRAGVDATCNAGGAGKWQVHYSETLAEATVVIVADKDEPGRKHARKVRELLVAEGCRVRVVEAEHGKDAYDHLAKGGTIETFVETVPFEEEVIAVGAPTFGAYLADIPGEQEFVFKDTLARGEVVLVTAYEGSGKTTMQKQLAVQAACGIHPWSGRVQEPKRVLFVDLENPHHDNWADFRNLARLAKYHGDWEAAEKNLIIVEADPIDVATENGFAFLTERVHAVKPDLLVIGPIYNLVGRDLSSEDDARPLKQAIDTIRHKYGCAVIMEHHVPKGTDASGVRALTPIGSSILLRWPAFGFGIGPILEAKKEGEQIRKPTGVYEWVAWRGKRRANRQWPEHLRWGAPGTAEWPWMLADPMEVADARQRAAKS